MIKLGIMQPYFFPYIGYWQLIKAVDQFVIYDDVNYIKGGWINRNRILLDNSVKYFNLYMCGSSSNKLINEISVENRNEIINKNKRILEAAYHKAPYFNDVMILVDDILYYKNSNLAQFLENSIKLICNYLQIETKIIISSSLIKDNSLKGQDKVIHICNLLGADYYYNAIGGKELYSKKLFQKNGIDLNFLKTECIEYKQFGKNFIPNLSILDVMMFNSVEKIKDFLDKYKLL